MLQGSDKVIHVYHFNKVKTASKHFEKKGKVDSISKSLLSFSIENQDSGMTTSRQVSLFFYFVLKSFSYFGD